MSWGFLFWLGSLLVGFGVTELSEILLLLCVKLTLLTGRLH